MARAWRYWLEDIIEAIREIQTYTEGMTLEQFTADQRTKRAVAYCFIIIGEAAKQLPEGVIAQHPHVPWAKMRAMRNVLVHEYPWMNANILWDTATLNLPPLLPVLEHILANTPDETTNDETTNDETTDNDLPL